MGVRRSRVAIRAEFRLAFRAAAPNIRRHMSSESQGSSLQMDLLAWYEINKRAVFIGIALMIVAAAVLIVWKNRVQSRVTDASQALLALQTKAGDTNTIPVDQLIAVAQKHAGTPAAVQANLLAARELFQQGRYSEARARFDAVASESGSDLQPIGLYGLAASLDAENKLSEAVSAYQAVITFPSAGALANQARLAKARVHETLKQPKEALALYDAISRSESPTLANDAMMRKAALLRLHPELEKPAISTNSINILPPIVTPSK